MPGWPSRARRGSARGAASALPMPRSSNGPAAATVYEQAARDAEAANDPGPRRLPGPGGQCLARRRRGAARAAGARRRAGHARPRPGAARPGPSRPRPRPGRARPCRPRPRRISTARCSSSRRTASPGICRRRSPGAPTIWPAPPPTSPAPARSRPTIPTSCCSPARSSGQAGNMDGGRAPLPPGRRARPGQRGRPRRPPPASPPCARSRCRRRLLRHRRQPAPAQPTPPPAHAPQPQLR